jgi:predicted RNase H-like nuclease (RuvC/YqgF family)
MTTQVDLKAKSEEELLLALQVLCSSLPEGIVIAITSRGEFSKYLKQDLELSASGLSEGVLDLCDQFVTNITEESNIVSKLTTIQKEFEKDKQKSQKLVQYATSMRQLQKDFIAMQSRTDELYAKLIQLVCTSCA